MAITYASAGVNIEAGDEAVRKIKNKVLSTFSDSVLTDLSSFGAVIDLKSIFENYKNPALVQSIDGVGTKLVIAKLMNRYDSLGFDIVGHCVNDILTIGAKPLTFLDYIASSKIQPNIVAQIVKGVADACIENGISLVGGETAEMPGIYLPGENDIAGCITGVVEKNKIITGKNIKPGDLVFGFASNGLHTNGYSLARKLFFEIAKLSVHTFVPELRETVGEALLKPHTSYLKPIFHLLKNQVEIKGIAHLTGGGFVGNIPRILPSNCSAEIIKNSWDVLPIFKMMQEIGEIDYYEMHRTFNMGIGLVMVVSPEEEQKINTLMGVFQGFKLYKIGSIIQREPQVIFS